MMFRNSALQPGRSCADSGGKSSCTARAVAGKGGRASST